MGKHAFLVCPECNKEKRSDKMEAHLKSCRKPKKYDTKCPICHELLQKQNVRRHIINNHHGDSSMNIKHLKKEMDGPT